MALKDIFVMVPCTSRTCSRCQQEFVVFGKERVCHNCRRKEAVKRVLGPLGLTSREIAVIKLVKQAKLNKEIAWDLKLTEGTIKDYLHRVFVKLNVKNRTELALREIEGI